MVVGKRSDINQEKIDMIELISVKYLYSDQTRSQSDPFSVNITTTRIFPDHLVISFLILTRIFLHVGQKFRAMASKAVVTQVYSWRSAKHIVIRIKQPNGYTLQKLVLSSKTQMLLFTFHISIKNMLPCAQNPYTTQHIVSCVYHIIYDR